MSLEQAASMAKKRALERERALDAQLSKEREAEAARLLRLQHDKRDMIHVKADQLQGLKTQEKLRSGAALERVEAQHTLARLQVSQHLNHPHVSLVLKASARLVSASARLVSAQVHHTRACR
jgi:hypothetical protein